MYLLQEVMRSSHFRRGDHAIHYIDSGQGPALILLHAFPNDGTLWQAQIEAFAATRRVIATDLRGFGGSNMSSDIELTIDDYADDIIALMQHLGMARAVIGGISLGGYVALSLVLRHPQTVAGLILANTRAGGDSAEGRAGREAMIRAVQAHGAAAVVEGFGDKPFGRNCPPEAKDLIRRMMRRQAPDAIVSALRAMAGRPDRTHQLSEIRVPTLIVSGTDDILIPSSESVAMHRAIAESIFVDIPQAGHLSNIDSPEPFNRAVAAFLATIPEETP